MISIIVLTSGNFSTSGSSGNKTLEPDISASVSGAITCTNTSVRLIGISKTEGVNYTWSGPGGFFSTAQNTVTAIPGEYTLTVKNPVNNTSASAIIKVLIDTAAPVNVKATVSGLLTCKDTLKILTGSSSIPDAIYAWKGPKSYSASIRKPTVKTPGFYKLTVTNPKNGCTSAIEVQVRQNITAPSGIAATASGILNCKFTTIELTGTSTTKGVIYNWSGPDFSSSERNSKTSAPGTYTLTVIDTSNGCSSMARVKVKQDVSEPEQVKAMVSDTLTCKTSKVVLTSSSTTPGVSYSWSGPDNLTTTESMLETSIAGSYTLTITNPENRCSVKKSLWIVKDTTGPTDVKVTASGALTCVVKSVTLKAFSSNPKVTYAWKGSEGFTSILATPLVSIPDKYEVIITKSATGCSVTKTVIVNKDMIAPEGVAASVSGSLSCETPQVELIAKASITQVIFNWTGPQGFKSNEKNPSIKLPGNYILTATNPDNGCASKAKVVVTGIACAENK